MEALDLRGQQFGRLTVLGEAQRVGQKRRWVCICECGNEKTVRQSDLRAGKTKSCGCIHKEIVGTLRRTHGKSGTRLYRIWRGMKSRCDVSNNPDYKWYGERGISTCAEWDRFEEFANWAEKNGYKENLTIDRIDPNKNYCPQNCRWITASENAERVIHYQSQRLITARGKSMNETQWARTLGVTQATISSWLKKYGEEITCKKIEGAIETRMW